MLEIWGRENSINVQKVLWCCEELGLAYRRIDAGGAFGRTDEARYRRRNPTGLVPTLVEGDFALWESNAIVRYLARAYGDGTLLPEDPRDRARVDQWMDWQLASLWPALRPAFIALIRTPPEQRSADAIAQAAAATAEQMTLLDAQLAKHRYVLGETFTAADIALGGTVHRWFTLDIARRPLPALTRWHAAIGARRGFAAAIPLT